MKRDFGIPRFGICDSCKLRDVCEHKAAHVEKCGSPIEIIKVKRGRISHFRKRRVSYVFDKVARAMNEAKIEAAKLRFVNSLKRIEPWQIRFSEDGHEIYYSWKTSAKRKRNAHGWRKVEVGDDGVTLRGWCENCGEEFLTVNQHRYICDKCHFEICDLCGIEYGLLRSMMGSGLTATMRKGKKR